MHQPLELWMNKRTKSIENTSLARVFHPEFTMLILNVITQINNDYWKHNLTMEITQSETLFCKF